MDTAIAQQQDDGIRVPGGYEAVLGCTPVTALFVVRSDGQLSPFTDEGEVCVTGATPPLHGDCVQDDTDAVQFYLDRRMLLPAGKRYKVELSRLRVPERIHVVLWRT